MAIMCRGVLIGRPDIVNYAFITEGRVIYLSMDSVDGDTIHNLGSWGSTYDFYSFAITGNSYSLGAMNRDSISSNNHMIFNDGYTVCIWARTEALTPGMNHAFRTLFRFRDNETGELNVISIDEWTGCMHQSGFLVSLYVDCEPVDGTVNYADGEWHLFTFRNVNPTTMINLTQIGFHGNGYSPWTGDIYSVMIYNSGYVNDLANYQKFCFDFGLNRPIPPVYGTYEVISAYLTRGREVSSSSNIYKEKFYFYDPMHVFMNLCGGIGVTALLGSGETYRSPDWNSTLGAAISGQDNLQAWYNFYSYGHTQLSVTWDDGLNVPVPAILDIHISPAA